MNKAWRFVVKMCRAVVTRDDLIEAARTVNPRLMDAALDAVELVEANRFYTSKEKREHAAAVVRNAATKLGMTVAERVVNRAVEMALAKMDERK